MSKEAIDVKKRIWKSAGKVLAKMIFAGILGAFVYFSLTMIFTSMGTSVIGESVYEQVTDAGGNTSWVLVETKYYANTTTTASTTAPSTTTTTGSVESTGTTATTESTTAADSSATGTTSTTAPTTTTTTIPRTSQPIYSEMSAGLTVVYNIVTTACMLLLLLCMCYGDMWALGDKDNNNVRLGRMAEDKWYGLKAGLLASVPGLITFIILIVSKFGLLYDKFFVLYRVLHLPFIVPLMWMTGDVTTASAFSGWLLLPIFLLLLIVPAVCALGYYLGYKEYSLAEHFLYKGNAKKKKKKKLF